ncbi:MAG: hypothetical protein ACPLPR_01555 [Bacillota bacterium]
MNYRRGYLAELKAMEALRAEGYVVARTAGSHSPFDIVAVGPQGVRLIQVKRAKRKALPSLLKAATEELRAVPSAQGVRCEVWFWVDRKGFVVRECVAAKNAERRKQLSSCHTVK